MKTGRILFLAVITISMLSALAVKETSELRKVEWLIGTWENKTLRGSMYETWDKTSEREYSGKSYILQEKDTIVFESIRLVQEQNELFYIPIVQNQNGGLPVRFTAKTISETQVVFENLHHDFPQLISYTKISSDSLVAEISGIKNGQVRKQTFPMRNVK